jgi:hypothetical protein
LREESQGRVFHPDVRMVDYFNKLKALYISTKEYYDIASRLGFGDFIRGTIALYNYSKMYNYELFIDDSHDIFKFFLKNSKLIKNDLE